MKVNDPVAVAEQYATETNLEARRAVYANATGPDPREIAFGAVAEASPDRVLEVGGGPGELSARIAEELGAETIMIDVSERMVELARVLRPGGRLVAATNAEAHMRELRELAGAAAWARPFTRENGADVLAGHFVSVERRDADGWVTIDREELVPDFVASLGGGVDPAPFSVPFRTRRASSIFVATR